MTTRYLHLQVWLEGVALFLLAPYPVWGNVGPPSSGGQIVAEPVGIQDVEITREVLTIDLRPLATNRLAEVDVVYNLTNRGAEKTLDLLFASGAAGVTNFQVWLDGQPLRSQPADSASIPASWQAPNATPSMHDERPLSYLAYGKQVTAPLAFSVVIIPGRHVLKVHFLAEAATHRYGTPTVYRQFAYVLAPARSWSRFGGLDVSIQLPIDWRVACTPTLTRKGDTLVGSFTDLPADAIALTVQAPEGWAYQAVSISSFWLFVLTGLGGLALCWRVGRASARRLALSVGASRNSQVPRAWPMSLAAGLVSALAVAGTGIFATFGPDVMLPAGQANHYGYDQVLAMIGIVLLSLLLVPIGFVIAQVTATISQNRRQADSRRPLNSS